MNKKFFVIIAVIISILIIILSFNIYNKEEVGVSEEVKNTELLGSDRDEHGCIGSAGYTWCEVKNKCLRVWEESCSIEDELKNYLRDNISRLSPEPEVLGGKFYVTNLELISPNKALVEYEDGHIALKADFVFSYDDNDTLIITDFKLVE